MAERITVVFDCMVIVQGLGSPTGPAHRCLELADEESVDWCLSDATNSEIDDVISRSVLRRKLPHLTTAAADQLLISLRTHARIVHAVPSVLSLPRDPDDEIYLDLAVATDADYLVTWNERHLTYLMRGDTPEGVEFCRRFPKLKIVDPPTFLREVDPTRRATP